MIERKDLGSWEREWRVDVKGLLLRFRITKNKSYEGRNLEIKVGGEVYSAMSFADRILEDVEEFCRWFADGMNCGLRYVKNSLQFLDW